MSVCSFCSLPATQTVEGDRVCDRCADSAAAWSKRHGKADQKAPAIAVPVRLGPRICSRCKAEDNTVVREGQVDFAGRSILEHFVTEELRFIKDRKEISAWLRSRGWAFRQHLGRNAMVRSICRTCLNESTVMQRDLDRKKKSDTDAGVADSYYQNLCEGL